MATLAQDFRYAIRTLRKSPAFTLIALLTLALGIGASAAIFSVVNTVLLRPLPYVDAARLVHVWSDLRNRDVREFPLSPGDFLDIREQATLFEDVAGVWTFRQPITGDGEPEQVRVAGVTPTFLRLMGARVALGRDFTEEDALPNPPPAARPDAGGAAPAPLPAMVILSHGFWQRRFGGDPGVIGRTIELGGGAQVVGVLAPGFELLFPQRVDIERAPDIWLAARLNFETASRIDVFLRAVGKLRPGVSIAAAQAQVEAVSAELRRQVPINETAGMHFRVEPMHQDLIADVRPAILSLMGAVLFVLLIACANVGSLLLVRASNRERELAVRAALGGTRTRLARQVLAESLVLAIGGAALGLVLTEFGVHLLLRLGPEGLPRIDDVAIDPIVLAFAVLAGLGSAAVFGLVPALRASRPDVADVLRGAGRTPGLGSGRMLRNGAVVAEVALAFVLLAGAGLLIRSFLELQRVDPGYDPAGVLTFEVTLPGARYPEAAQREAFNRQLRERLGALPGVRGVTAANPLPLDGQVSNARWGTETAVADPEAFRQATVHVVLPGYFETLRTRLVAGRTFADADNGPDATVIVIDERLAELAFPGESAIGRRILARIRSQEPEWFEIIGVVGHQRHTSLASDGRETIFFADGLLGHGAVNRWGVRTTGDPLGIAAAVRNEIAQLDPLLPVSDIRPMSAFVDRAMAPTRFALTLIAVFAGIAVLLSAVGLYGVLSTLVRQRTAEIGMRLALGAPRATILGLVVGHGLRLSTVGIAIGLVAAFALTRLMQSMLVGVAPTDIPTFIATALLFLAIASVACFLPARRAAAVEPTVALRGD